MNRFLETWDLSKLNNDEVKSLTRSITSKEIGITIKNLPKNKNTDQDGFMNEFLSNLQRKLTTDP